MGDLYSVYVVDEMHQEARDFFAETYGVAFPTATGGRRPTLRELRMALDAMPHCRVTYSNQTGSWQADIHSLARRRTRPPS